MVELTDDEFVAIYQGLFIGVHPGDNIGFALMTEANALNVIDAVPETDQLRNLALVRIRSAQRALRDRDQEDTPDLDAERPSSEAAPPS